MKFTVTRDALLRALRIIAPALARSNIAEKYAGRLRAAESGIAIYLTNLDWDVRCAAPAAVAEQGEIWVVRDLFRSLPWPVLGPDIEFAVRKGTLSIHGAAGTYTTQIQADPGMAEPRIGAKIIATLPGALFGQLIRLGSIAMAGQTEDQTTIRGVWLRTEDTTLVCDAWDGMWLSRASINVTGIPAFRLALPAHAALTLSAAAKLHEAITITTSLDHATVTLEAGDALLTARALAAKIPDTQAATLPANLPIHATVQADLLAQPARLAMPVVGTDHTTRTRLETREDGLHLDLPYAPNHGRFTGFSATVPATIMDAGMDLIWTRQLVACLGPLGATTINLSLGRTRGTWVMAQVGQINFVARLGSVAGPKTRNPLAVEPESATVQVA